MMFQHQLFETRVVTSKELMRSLKPDFDDVERSLSRRQAPTPTLSIN